MSSMEKLSPGDLRLRAARLTLVEHLDDELAPQRPKRLVLRPVGALEQSRREAFDRLLTRRRHFGTISGFHRARGSLILRVDRVGWSDRPVEV